MFEKIKSHLDVPDWYNTNSYNTRVLNRYSLFHHIAFRLDFCMEKKQQYQNNLPPISKLLKQPLKSENIIDAFEEFIVNPPFYFDMEYSYDSWTDGHDYYFLPKKSHPFIFNGIKPLNKQSIDMILPTLNGFDGERKYGIREPLEKLNQDELKLKKLWDKFNQLIKEEDLLSRGEVEKSSKIQNKISETIGLIEKFQETDIRDLETDFLCVLFNRPTDKTVHISLDLSVPDISLKDSFDKLLKQLRTLEHLKKSHQQTEVIEHGQLTDNQSILERFDYFKILQYFDLTFWAASQGKQYTQHAISRILFSDDDERYKDKDPIGILRSTVRYMDEYFCRDFMSDLCQQISTELNIKEFNRKN